jgi:hypothetical protein
MSRAYGIFRIQLLGRILAQGLTPTQVAEELEREGLSQVCGEEITRYRAYGARWPGAVQGVDGPAVLPTAAPIAPLPDSQSSPAEKTPARGDSGILDPWELEA